MANPIRCTCNCSQYSEDRSRLADTYMGKSLQSDMTFFIESDGTSIPAHSLIVSAASDVLDKLIHGTGSIVNTDGVVKVPDCPREDFLILLRYLYTPGFFQEVTIEQSNVLLTLAHYFDLHNFEDICAKPIMELLTFKNVCSTFDQVHFMDNALTKKCIEIMKINPIEILSDGSLMRMQDSALNKVLARDDLFISCESVLLEPMLDWANAQCIQNELSITGKNLRAVLKDRIYLIRFGAMSPEAFSKSLKLVECDFFSFEEIASIMFSISKQSECENLAFSCKRRKESHRLVINAQQETQIYQSHYYTRNIETIYMKNVAQTVYIVGFESDFGILSILDKSETVQLKFIKTGYEYMFNPPIGFSEGQCSFCIKFSPRHSLLSVKTENGDSNVFIKANSKTVLSAIYYRL